VFDETMDDGDDFGLAKKKKVSALALVPWADALNHSPRASAVASLRFDARTNVAELRASRAYEKNEEVFDTYGVAKTPAETFLAYGFAAFPPDVSSSSSEDAAADDDDDEEETSSFADDACVIPGSWFWAESEKAELERNAADASNALSLLAREEAAAGASHRSVVLGYLVAAGAAPEDVDITLRVKSGGDRNKGKTSSKSLAPVGDAALRWCAAATATRAELFEAGWRGPFSTDPAAAATEAKKKRALSRAEAARVVHALGSNQAARARARRARAPGGAASGKLPLLRQRAVARGGGGARAFGGRGRRARDRDRDRGRGPAGLDRRGSRRARRDRRRRGGACARVGGARDACRAGSARGVDVSEVGMGSLFITAFRLPSRS
jgi:hypothetical protein